jgi:hypothetical protein
LLAAAAIHEVGPGHIKLKAPEIYPCWAKRAAAEPYRIAARGQKQI